MPETTYIHCGHRSFRPELFEQVRNRAFTNKPYGGLWASPENAPYGWQKWCANWEHDSGIRNGMFCFTLAPWANILSITREKDAYSLPVRDLFPGEWPPGTSMPVLPDFEKIAESYDAIDFRLSSDKRLYHALYGWDCDSLLVLNADAISCCK